MDTVKKPSFCIADILHFGDNESVAGSSALVTPLGARAQVHSTASPLRPSALAPDASVFGGRVNATSAFHRHGIHLTSVARTTFFSQSVPQLSSKDLKFGIDRILSADFEPKSKESSSLRGKHQNTPRFFPLPVSRNNVIRLPVSSFTLALFIYLLFFI